MVPPYLKSRLGFVNPGLILTFLILLITLDLVPPRPAREQQRRKPGLARERSAILWMQLACCPPWPRNACSLCQFQWQVQMDGGNIQCTIIHVYVYIIMNNMYIYIYVWLFLYIHICIRMYIYIYTHGLVQQSGTAPKSRKWEFQQAYDFSQASDLAYVPRNPCWTQALMLVVGQGLWVRLRGNRVWKTQKQQTRKKMTPSAYIQINLIESPYVIPLDYPF